MTVKFLGPVKQLATTSKDAMPSNRERISFELFMVRDSGVRRCVRENTD
jgi:hypothetical protein